MDLRALARRPQQNAGIARFIPEVGLEDAESAKRRQVFGEEPLFVGAIVGG